MAITPITPVEVGPSTANVWEAVDLSAVIPAGATGIILHIVNTSGAANYTVGVRKTGSADDIKNTLRFSRHIWSWAGVNASRQADFYTTNLANVDFYVTGYFESEAVFFDTFVGVPTTNGVWDTIDISADTGADTAIAAILVRASASNTLGVRMFGSTDARLSVIDGYGGVIVGVDGSERFEINQSVTATNTYLIGYLKDTANAVFHTNATDMSLGTTGAWTDLAALPAGATGAFIEVYDGTNTLIDFGLRKNGSAEDIVRRLSTAHAWAVVEADGSQLIEGQIADLSVDFFRIGYVTGVAGADLVKVLDETVQASEATVRPMTLTRAIAETIQAAEALTRVRALTRLRAEAAQIGEQSVAARAMIRVRTETQEIGEAAQKTMALVRAAAESVAASEIALRARAMSRSRSETVEVGEGTVVARALTRAASEAVEIGETAVNV